MFQSQSSKHTNVPDKYNDRVVLFASNKHISKEAEYYNALLELQQDHIIGTSDIVLLRKSIHQKEYKNFGIKEAPAIVKVSKTGEIIFKVSGVNVNREEIKEVITNSN
jgi:hypothetical protein